MYKRQKNVAGIEWGISWDVLADSFHKKEYGVMNCDRLGVCCSDTSNNSVSQDYKTAPLLIRSFCKFKGIRKFN